jgi:hypothetical protein
MKMTKQEFNSAFTSLQQGETIDDGPNGPMARVFVATCFAMRDLLSLPDDHEWGGPTTINWPQPREWMDQCNASGATSGTRSNPASCRCSCATWPIAREGGEGGADEGGEEVEV